MLAGSLASWAQDAVTTATYGNAKGNTTRTLAVAFTHASDYVAFSADLVLPEGTTVTAVSAKAPLKNGGTVNLESVGGSATESTDFKLAYNQDGTTCKVLGYNLGNEKVGGTSGDVLLAVTLTTAEGITYDASTVTAQNIKFVKVEGDATKTYTEMDFAQAVSDSRLWGDVVVNQEVDATDYQAVANIVTKLGNGAIAIDAFAADVDQSDEVDATDYQAVANIVTGK